jgi:hypothetical protein
MSHQPVAHHRSLGLHQLSYPSPRFQETKDEPADCVKDYDYPSRRKAF